MTDHISREDADLDAVYQTFTACSVGDSVHITSHYPAVTDAEQEYFSYLGDVVTADTVNGMPGIAVASNESETPAQARIVCPLSADNSLDIRLIKSDGSVHSAGWVTSLTRDEKRNE
jgi:hypothetical protein